MDTNRTLIHIRISHIHARSPCAGRHWFARCCAVPRITAMHCCAVSCYAVTCCAALCSAAMCCAGVVLCCAVMRCAVLRLQCGTRSIVARCAVLCAVLRYIVEHL